MTTLDRTRDARKGVASLELVMCFPILVFLIAMLFTVYFATMMKSQLTMEVRHYAWRMRPTNANVGPRSQKEQSTTKQLSEDTPFGLFDAATSGRWRSEMTSRVLSYRNWYPNVPRNITWGNVVLIGSWDHRQIEFDTGNLIYPHISILTKMISGGASIKFGDVNKSNSLDGILSIF